MLLGTVEHWLRLCLTSERSVAFPPQSYCMERIAPCMQKLVKSASRTWPPWEAFGANINVQTQDPTNTVHLGLERAHIVGILPWFQTARS